jgi:hypothetical protein
MLQPEGEPACRLASRFIRMLNSAQVSSLGAYFLEQIAGTGKMHWPDLKGATLLNDSVRGRRK